MQSTSIAVVLGIAAVLGACATTSVVNSWKDPSYSGGPVRSVLVVGISSQASVRRVFEETFAEALKAQGVNAVPSYTIVPEEGKLAEETLKAAAERSGTESVLISRMVGRQTQVSVTPATPPPMVGMRRYYHGYYSSAWMGYYEPASVNTYAYIMAETTLFRTESPDPVWSGTTRTQEPDDVRRATEGFSKAVMEALRKDGLI